MISIMVNGRPRQITAPCSINELLTSLQLEASGVAVERNRSIVFRQDFAATSLQDGDRLEIVRFVGGG